MSYFSPWEDELITGDCLCWTEMPGCLHTKLRNLFFFFFSLTPPKNCCDRVSQVSEERKEREVKEARRWVGYGCRDACGGAGLASLFGRQRCLPRVLVPSPAWQCFSGRCCKAFSVAQVSTWSQSRAGHAVNFYPLGSAFCKPISPQHSQCSKMEQPDSSKLQRIANFGL